MERERERKMDVREKHQSIAFCMHPDQKSNLQPRDVPRLRIKPAT